MDARTLLESVGETYAKLDSFEVEVLFTSESGDDDAFRRSSYRSRAIFAAPNKVRINHGGRFGSTSVTDGVDYHHYFTRPRRYMTSGVEPGGIPEGFFRPEYPLAGGSIFLFHKIAERVVTADLVREEPGTHVLSVTYDPPAHRSAPFRIDTSPVTFWIDAGTNLVLRMEGEMTHHFREQFEESHSDRVSCVYTNGFINQPIPPQTFEYVPPAGAIDESEHPRRSGGGHGRYGPDGGYETWHSADLVNGAFVDNFELKIRGREFQFERRLTFLDKVVRVTANIAGPKGALEREFSIPL